MTVSHSADLTITYDTTAKDVKEFLADIPDDAKFDVTQTQYYNQFEPGMKKITARWQT